MRLRVFVSWLVVWFRSNSLKYCGFSNYLAGLAVVATRNLAEDSNAIKTGVNASEQHGDVDIAVTGS